MHQPGTNVRSLRLHLNLKQKDLAKLTGLDQGTISNIERGAMGFSRESIEKIAKALGVTVGVLFADGDTVDAAAIGARRVPVIRPEDVAAWKGMDDAEIDVDEARFLMTELAAASRYAFALEIADRRNAPVLEPRDMAIFDLDVQPWPGALVACVDAAGALHLGRFRQLAGTPAAPQPFEVVPADGFHPPLSSAGLRLKAVLVEVRRYMRPDKI